jgi:hypothetical protein
MDDGIEFEVRSAAAALDGDTATIALVTDRGPLSLRMQRTVLGALGGTIARALWPKAGEAVATAPELPEADAAPHDVPTQPALPEPDPAPHDA